MSPGSEELGEFLPWKPEHPGEEVYGQWAEGCGGELGAVSWLAYATVKPSPGPVLLIHTEFPSALACHSPTCAWTAQGAPLTCSLHITARLFCLS